MERDLSQTEAAERLDKSVETLRRWRRAGYGPSFRRIGVSVRYPPAAIDAFVESQTGAPVPQRKCGTSTVLGAAA